VDLRIEVNGVGLSPGAVSVPTDLAAAGLERLAPWHRWLRHLPPHCQYWEAADPRVVCFDGEVEIYPCRHSYLDRDRQWGTGCLVRLHEGRVAGIEVRIIDGVYAASNLYARFLEAGVRWLGEPDRAESRLAEWSRGQVTVAAMLAEDAMSALFRVELGNGDAGR